MHANLRILALLALALSAGCASGPPLVDVMQPEAVGTAMRRAQFELSCNAISNEVISRETIPPLSVNFGQERVEYTIGVSGCGKRATYVVMCSQFTQGCFAGGGRTAIQQ